MALIGFLAWHQVPLLTGPHVLGRISPATRRSRSRRRPPRPPACSSDIGGHRSLGRGRGHQCANVLALQKLDRQDTSK